MITKHGKVQLVKVNRLDLNCLHTSPFVEDLNRLCKDGSLHEAISALETLDRDRCPVSTDILVCLLRKCAKEKDFAVAKRLHFILHDKKSNPTTFLVDHLIRLFTSCGSLVDANQVFCKISKPSIFTWNAIILAHAKLGEGCMAINLYCKMQAGAQKPDKYLLSCILKVCSTIRHIDQGRLVHHQIISYALLTDLFVDNALVFMYVECGSIEEAQSVFDSLKNRNVATWSVLITGHCQYGSSARALELFQNMQGEGIRADKVVFLCVLKACSFLRQGMFIHNQVVVQKLDSDVMIASAVVYMYAKCVSLQEACTVFNNLQDRDAALWSSLISGCTDLRQDDLALDLFRRMLFEGTKPNDFTFSCIIKACGNAGVLEQGRIIHDMLLRRDFTLDVIVGNTLIDMYAKCGALNEAYRVFDRLTVRSIISWGTIIGAFTDYGCGLTALEIFDKLQQTDLMPDNVVVLSVIKACGSTGDLLKGRQIHANAIRRGLVSDVVIGNTLVDMYLKCNRMEEAQSVFDGLPYWDWVSWSTMLTGYIQQHQWAMALNLFGKLQEDLKLDKVIFLNVLEACSNLGAMGQAKLIHDKIVRHSLEADTVIGSALLDTYCKCGYLHEAYLVFERLPFKDVVTWGAMIAGLVHDGDWPLAKKCLLEMRQQGMKPNQEIYTCILIACSCAGLLDEGQRYFNLMTEDHCNFAEIDHFSCMVDLLSRAGLLKESEDLMQTMPCMPNELSWTSLLSSCRTYNNPSIASHCFTEAVEANPGDASGYILMCDVHTNLSA